MAILLLSFLCSSSIIFGLCALAFRREPGEKVVEQRIAALGIARKVMEPLARQGTIPLQVKKAAESDWIEKNIGSTRIYRWLSFLVLQSKSKMPVTRVLFVSLGMALAAIVTTMVLGLPALVCAALGLLAGYLPVGILSFQRDRRVKQFNAELPDCIETCARALRTGNSIVAAIEIVTEQATGPAKEEFGEVFKKQNYGLPIRDALLQMLERVPSVDLKVVVTGILVQRDTGGNLAEILDRTASVIRDRIRIQGELRIHTAQGRLTGWILIALPVVLMLVINLLNPGYSKILFSDETGRKLLYIGLVLLCFGGFLIRQIVKGMEV